MLKDQPSLAGFILAGGSALSLHIAHRLSEDLDLVFDGERLPRKRLDSFLIQAAKEGIEFRRHDDPAALEDFIAGGMELHDYQQDFLASGEVKISFFAPDDTLRKVIGTGAPNGVRVATLEELFKSKCIVSALRSKTRDWLDLYALLRDHGYTTADFRRAFLDAGAEASLDISLSRLCSGIPQKTDEGYAHLMAEAPGLDTMKSFFIRMRDELEISQAAEAAGRLGRGNDSARESE